MTAIVVCPLSRLVETVVAHGADDVVTLLSPGTEMPEHGAARHITLDISDISEPLDGHVLAGRAHVGELIAFIQAWPRTTPLVIHCWAGVSRSTAAAFVALCTLAPEIPEEKHADTLRAASPTATPNRRIVALADAFLGRDGRMIAAVERIGRGADVVYEGTPFVLPLARSTG